MHRSLVATPLHAQPRLRRWWRDPLYTTPRAAWTGTGQRQATEVLLKPQHPAYKPTHTPGVRRPTYQSGMWREVWLRGVRRRDYSQEIFKLKPSKDSAEFANLVDFVSHVSPCYPTETAGYAAELMSLLDGHHAVLDATLRRSAHSPLLCVLFTLPERRSNLTPTHRSSQKRPTAVACQHHGERELFQTTRQRMNAESNGAWPVLSRARRGRVDGNAPILCCCGLSPSPASVYPRRFDSHLKSLSLEPLTMSLTAAELVAAAKWDMQGAGAGADSDAQSRAAGSHHLITSVFSPLPLSRQAIAIAHVRAHRIRHPELQQEAPRREAEPLAAGT